MIPTHLRNVTKKCLNFDAESGTLPDAWRIWEPEKWRFHSSPAPFHFGANAPPHSTRTGAVAAVCMSDVWFASFADFFVIGKLRFAQSPLICVRFQPAVSHSAKDIALQSLFKLATRCSY